MKSMKWTFIALFFTVPLMAQASCESVKADISKKIINNGVPESGFTLDIVANDQADHADGQVVGHCENDTQKIIYKRDGAGNSTQSTEVRSSQDAPAQ